MSPQSLKHMLDEYALVMNPHCVVRLSDLSTLQLPEFRKLYAGIRVPVETTNAAGLRTTRLLPAVRSWMRSPWRLTASRITFAPSRPRFFTAEDGEVVLNRWSPQV